MSLTFFTLASATGNSQSRSFRLSAPEALVASGVLKHLLPRFSLKTQVRIELVGAGEADARFAAEGKGTPVFAGLDADWVLVTLTPGNEHVGRFEDWITSEVGRNTIESFQPGGKALFTAAVARQKDDETVVLPGNVVEGEKLAVTHCGRCHMVNEATRLTTIGSSPSFAVMRGFSDWQARFEAFFALNPHPSFTLIDGVTEPFDVSRPSPIVPLEMTLEELEAILAFVSQIPPADLGAPIQYQ
ncbi:c-type cytochrome [Roseibium sediminicola]|uniref:Cytochrome c n=1 Tax=Roseibium sediminicola TaxID=2933272 RepID=A0ABT0GVV4_9HYPH|nr:cytochrome c [Roseibium sp. CAU 1639]MCK7612943.1 cytochrome c [Roseibium sp. CAU 1639]